MAFAWDQSLASSGWAVAPGTNAKAGCGVAERSVVCGGSVGGGGVAADVAADVGSVDVFVPVLVVGDGSGLAAGHAMTLGALEEMQQAAPYRTVHREEHPSPSQRCHAAALRPSDD